MKKDIVLFFGGTSEERLVSVASAQNLAQNYSFSELVFQSRNEQLFKVTLTELLAHQDVFTQEFRPQGIAYAKSLEDVVNDFRNKVLFLALHGTQGENGQVQSLLEQNKIAFTGSGSKSSHLAFEKNLAKKVIADAGMRLPLDFKFNVQQITKLIPKFEKFLNLHKKMILKPTASGSSFGLHIISTHEQLQEALVAIAKEDYETYLAENFIQGRELTVGVVQQDDELIALPASEIIINQGRAFDYEGKYLGAGSTELTPAQLESEQLEEVQRMALNAHIAFGCYGYSRTDLILTEQGPCFLETNTLPGLSKPSFFPQQLLAADFLFKNFIEAQIHLAEHRYESF
jgi:D-alanine-D-alanine ligase